MLDPSTILLRDSPQDSLKELLEHYMLKEQSCRFVAKSSGIPYRTLLRWCTDSNVRIQKGNLVSLLQVIAFLPSVDQEDKVNQIMLAAGFNRNTAKVTFRSLLG